MNAVAASRPVIFGEVLFDVFPEGQIALGGASFNVAWNLAGLGLDPLFISRIGTEKLGKAVIGAMRNQGLDTSGVQVDDKHPTGVVKVSLAGMEPTFSILPDQAYDFVDYGEAKKSLARSRPSIFYYGTLSMRSKVSNNSLFRLRHLVGNPSFVDVNLRSPWWNADWVDRAITGASWVKLNRGELVSVSDTMRSTGKVGDAALRMVERYGLDGVIVTLGAKGALVATGGETYSLEPQGIYGVVDSVGAGDAFSAVTIMGILKGWSYPLILERAVSFAGKVCQLRGATTMNRDFYKTVTNEWK